MIFIVISRRACSFDEVGWDRPTPGDGEGERVALSDVAYILAWCVPKTPPFLCRTTPRT